MIRVFTALTVLLVAACGPSPAPQDTAAGPAADPAPATAPARDLGAILAAQPEEIKARYPWRHPKETLQFLGIEPGMTVVEALPGGGWYSGILLPWLGRDGRLIGATYAQDMWPKFGFFDDEYIESMRSWATDWPREIREQHGDDVADVDAFVFGSMPESMTGTADAVLFIRALHNLARFDADGGYLATAIDDAWRVLKPGGSVGVVQHEARPGMPDDWASGAAGYLKKQFVIDRMTAAGFEFVAESDVNDNPADRPTTDEFVWRLPPGYSTSEEDTEMRAQMAAIGESHRMTLKFRKPL